MFWQPTELSIYMKKSPYKAHLYVASKQGSIKIMKLLLDKGAGFLESGFYGACETGNLEAVDFMISRGIKSYD